MKSGKFILSVILFSCILSCNNSSKRLTCYYEEKKNMESDSIISDDSELKNFFILYGKDSLLMIPNWVLANLYESPLESYNKLYVNYQEFESDFLNSSNYLSERLYWSYHIKIDKDILNDYNCMLFDYFKKKYWVIEGKDTMSYKNDTTLAYCFDKHGYYCIFNYLNEGKIKVIKPRLLGSNRE